MCFLNCLFRLLELLGIIRGDIDNIEPQIPDFEFANVAEDADPDDFNPNVHPYLIVIREEETGEQVVSDIL